MKILNFKNIIRSVVPPIIWSGASQLKRFVRSKGKDELFDGRGGLFKKHISTVKNYAEYGCGKSTLWLAENCPSCYVVSVESDRTWADQVAEKVKGSKVLVGYVNLGVIGGWGRPLTYKYRKDFFKYIDYPWGEGQQFDLVLIDGRFRVACFLCALLKAKVGTKIIFDDYVGRDHYSIVEDFVVPEEVEGRQALFVVPEEKALDKEKIAADLEKFIYVMD